MANSQQTDKTCLRQMIDGYQVAQAISVAATLGIADLLAEGPKASIESGIC